MITLSVLVVRDGSELERKVEPETVLVVDADARGGAAQPVEAGPDERDHEQGYEAAHHFMLPSQAEPLSRAQDLIEQRDMARAASTSLGARSTRNSLVDSL